MTKVLRLIGSVLICCGLAIAWWQYQEARLAGVSANTILKQLGDQSRKQALATENGEMPIETIDGVAYIGNISIPSLNIHLPVAAKYTFEQLATTPTRYAGSYMTNDLVICAHDYPSHFEPLRSISVGEEIQFKTVTGHIYRYVITNREVISPTAVDQVFKERATDQDWDLSLFTCTPSGMARVLIRCSQVELIR